MHGEFICLVGVHIIIQHIQFTKVTITYIHILVCKCVHAVVYIIGSYIIYEVD